MPIGDSNNLGGFDPLFLKSPKLANSSDWCNGFLAGTRFHPSLGSTWPSSRPISSMAIGGLCDPEGQAERPELERLVALNVLGLAIALSDQQRAD